MSYSIDPEGVETSVIHELVDFAHADVLEVGCGDGRLTRRYSDKAASVLGIDPEEEMIRRAREAIPETIGAKVEFLASDINDVELAPDAYDVAILAHSL